MTTNGEDGWVGLTWNYAPLFDKNFTIAVFDRTHMFSMGWVYELPFLKNRNDALGTILGGWQLNGVAAWFTGTPDPIWRHEQRHGVSGLRFDPDQLQRNSGSHR